MTMIQYYPSDNELLMQGHAGTAPSGRDLVCCACSTLGYTLLQALDDRGIDYSVREDADVAVLHVIADPLDDERYVCRVIFNTIVSGLRALSAQFPEAINYKETGGEY